jgi:hypothetical protein
MNNVTQGTKPQRSRWSVIGWIFLVLLGLWILLGIIGRFSSDESSSRLSIGGTAYLVISGNQYVNVAVSESACKQMEDAYRALDQERLSGLLLSGLMLPADNHSRVLILDRGINRAKVKILSGNQNGETGWVPIGYLKSS